LNITLLIKSAALLILTSFLFSMQLFVPTDHDVYDFLERQSTRGYIPEFMNDTKPLQRDEIAEWLVKISELENELHRVDRELLNYYLSEYRYELTDLRHPCLGDTSDSRLGFSSWKNYSHDMRSMFNDDIFKEQNHIYIHESENNTIWVDTDFRVRGEGKNSTLRFVDQLGAYASIQAGEHLALFVDGYFFHQYVPDDWPDPADEFNGNWLNIGGDIDGIATWDRSQAYANISGKFGVLTIAHHPVNWGNSLNSVILSDNATSFGSLRWSKRFKHFKYSYLHGSLMMPTYSSLGDDGRYYIPKYLAAHRIEIMFTPRFHVNFSEMITYGGEDRIPEITYLVPIIFLWPSEHALGDRDNKMIALEAELFPFNGLRLYGSVFLDELVFGQIFNDFWANKYALQAGFQWSPRSLPADLILEATAVHPWTYVHHFSFGSYTHHGKELGFFAGPNTQLISGKLNYDLSAKHSLSLSYNSLFEGADSVLVGDTMYPLGGDVNQDDYERFRDLDHETTWLMGDITRTTSIKLDWIYRWKNQISFLTSCEWRNIQGQSDIYYSIQLNLNY